MYFFLSDNHKITSNLQRTVYSNGTLVFSEVSRDSVEGFYKCTARNSHNEEASAETKIKVIGNYYRLWGIFRIKLYVISPKIGKYLLKIFYIQNDISSEGIIKHEIVFLSSKKYVLIRLPLYYDKSHVIPRR